MKQLLKRWRMESPLIFKKILYVCVTAGAIGTAFLAGKEYLPPFTQVIAPYLITAGIVGSVISKITVKNPESLQ